MNITKRFAMHRCALKKGTHHCIYLQRAVNKHGIDSFRFEIIEETIDKPLAEIHELEQKYIDTTPDLYNIGSVGGGDNLSKHPYKEDIIRRRTETNATNLKLLSEEERKQRFAHCVGDSNGNWKNGGESSKLCPVCNNKRISVNYATCAKCRDRTGENNPFYGKKHSEKTLEKLRSNTSWAAYATPEEQSYTNCYEISYPDSKIKIVFGMKAIAEEFNVSIANVHATIKRMAAGKIPTKSVFKNHMIKQIERPV